MGFLTTILGIYSLLIIIRIILTWFPDTGYSRLAQFLSRITDPYLDWWRRKLNLRVGVLDISPLAGILALSVAQNITSSIARQGSISLGFILAIVISAVWSAASFILAFCIIALVLRLFAYITNKNIYNGQFWQIIDIVTRPLMYRINRIIFGNKIVSYTAGIIVSIAALVVLWILGRFVISLLTSMLMGLPL
jgi:YggT family protein